MIARAVTVVVLIIFGQVAVADCTPDQVEKLVDAGFDKSEIQDMCGGSNSSARGDQSLDRSQRSEKRRYGRSDYPKYCCTQAGRLGPYPNDSVEEGESCFGTTPYGQRLRGRACF